MSEIWRAIKGYEGYYEVSNLGRVRSLDRQVKTRYGGLRNFPGKMLSIKRETDGYLRVSLSINGKKRLFQLHRIVAEAFIPNPENKPFINHINGVKDDNSLDNLEWCTVCENMRHSHEHLERKNRKLTAAQVKEIRRLDAEKELKPTEIAKKFGITYNDVWDIRVGRKWSWLE